MHRITETTIWEAEKIKGSRFVGCAAPVKTPREVQLLLDSTRVLHRSAGHHCYAFRLQGGAERSSDDGEPRGSSGPPILQRLQRLDIVDSMVIVSRYFGGTKLGVGGLIRAYGGTAGGVLQRCELEEVVPGRSLCFRYQYSDSAAVDGCCLRYGAQTTSQEFSQDISRVVWVNIAASSEFCVELNELCAGRIQWVDQPQ